MVTPSADTSVSNGVYVPGGITNGDVKPAISTTPLADFLMQLEEYTPTVSKVATFNRFVSGSLLITVSIIFHHHKVKLKFNQESILVYHIQRVQCVGRWIIKAIN